MTIIILFIGLSPIAQTNALTLNQVYSMPKNDYLREFAKQSKEEFCQEKSPFQKCFSVTESKCRESIYQGVVKCSKLVKLPEQINFVNQGPLASKRLATCTSKYFISENKGKFAKIPICKWRNTWR